MMNPRVSILVVIGALLIPVNAGAEDRPIQWRGLLDLAMTGTGPAVDYNLFNHGDSNFDTHRLRLFAEKKVSEQFDLFAQILFDRFADARLIGGYATYRPYPTRDLQALAGLIPWRIGAFAERTYSHKNPLIGVPLMYQYHTTLRSDLLPPNEDALLAAAGMGQFGPIYDASGRGFRGMPVIYDLCWDFGVMVTGSQRPVEYSAGFVNGAPSSQAPGRDSNAGKSWLGRLGLQPLPGVRMGVSGSFGPYLSDRFQSQLPAGKTVNGYAQKLLMGDVEWSFAHVELRGEGFHNTWETPTVGDLNVNGGYVEARVALPAGTYAAGRYGVMRFGDVVDSTGTSRAWDHDIDRIELGVGYRVNRYVILKGVFQQNVLRPPSGDTRASLYAAQASIRF